jgi:hypothetical protein
MARKGKSGEMTYILRLVQQYHPSSARAFLELEAQFQELERRSPLLPQGGRYQPLLGVEPTNTLVWECKCGSLADVQKTLEQLASDPAHAALFEKQSPYISAMRTEVYRVLDL